MGRKAKEKVINPIYKIEILVAGGGAKMVVNLYPCTLDPEPCTFFLPQSRTEFGTEFHREILTKTVCYICYL